jgi:hypothetical protein
MQVEYTFMMVITCGSVFEASVTQPVLGICEGGMLENCMSMQSEYMLTLPLKLDAVGGFGTLSPSQGGRVWGLAGAAVRWVCTG